MGTMDFAALQREQSDLRKRLDAIDARLKANHGAAPEACEIERGPTVTVTVPSNGFKCPTDGELRALAELAYSEYDFLQQCSDDAFKRTFIAIGHMRRLDAPTRKIAFCTHVENVGDVAARLGFIGPVPGNAVLNALICHNDVAWIAHASHLGQMLECSLDPWSGRPCSNAYLGLLAGQPFVPPLPARPMPGGSNVPLPRFSVYRTT